MQCPVCHSDNVQKLSLVYEQGTQNIRTTGRSVGTGAGYGRGGLLVGGGSSTIKTTGKSQSIAAQKAAPPDRKKIALPIGIAVAGTLLIWLLHSMMLGVALIAIGVFIFWRFHKYNSETFPPLYEQWQKSWLCNKCGTIYQQ